MKKKIAIVGIIASLVAVIAYLFASKWELQAEWKNRKTA
jgi:hypothetical protein